MEDFMWSKNQAIERKCRVNKLLLESSFTFELVIARVTLLE